jgi:hypothetical protein
MALVFGLGVVVTANEMRSLDGRDQLDCADSAEAI